MAGIAERGVDRVGAMDGRQILHSVDEIEKLDKVARPTFGLDKIESGGIRINILSGNFGDGPVFDTEPSTNPGV